MIKLQLCIATSLLNSAERCWWLWRRQWPLVKRFSVFWFLVLLLLLLLRLPLPSQAWVDVDTLTTCQLSAN